MKIISSHVDGHAALLVLVDEAEKCYQRHVSEFSLVLQDLNEKAAARAALPWFKRLIAPSLEPAETYFGIPEMRCKVFTAQRRIKWLEQVKFRAKYELTFEFTEDETEILFRNALYYL